MLSNGQLELLYQRLHYYCPQPGVLSKVFQILTNSNSQDYRLLFSWPPDASHEYSNKPSAKDFARRAEGVLPAAYDNKARTSCTRRWRIGGTMSAINGEVESVFIPHGTIMFACHTIQPSPRHGTGISLPQYAARPHEATPSYDVSPHPPMSTSMSSLGTTQYQQQSWQGSPQLNYSRWTGNGTSTVPQCSVRNSAYEIPYGDPRGTPHAYPAGCDVDRHGDISALAPGVVPPPRHRVSPGAPRDAVGRAGNRPVGVPKCVSCKVTSSPEWRKGPSGKKELCNACGLRYARSRAKKEGHPATAQRRKKEKVAPMATQPQSSPLAMGGALGSGTRSLNSPDGSEGYSQHSPVAPEPSPSPPTGSLSFVHYSHPPPPPPPPLSLAPQTSQRVPRSDVRGMFHTGCSTPPPLASHPAHRRGIEDVGGVASRMVPPFSNYVGPTASTSPGPLPSFERDRADDGMWVMHQR